MIIQYYLSTTLFLLLSFKFVTADCTYDKNSDQWSNCVEENFYLLSAKCGKGTNCSVTTSGKFLYLCKSSSDCSLITNSGYYLNESSNELFNCKGEGNCSLITKSPVYSEETTYYIDGNSINDQNKYSKLIKCVGNGSARRLGSGSDGGGSDGSSSDGGSSNENNNKSSGFKCTKENNTATTTTINHFISIEVDSNPDGYIITCSTQGCFLEDSSISGYFINSNSDKSEGKIILCKNGCDIVDDDEYNECDGAGNFIVKKETNSIKAYLCTSDSEKSSDIIEIPSNTEESDKYISLTIEVNNAFPNINGGSKVCIKISGEGSVLVVDDKYCPIKDCVISTGENCFADSYYLVHPTSNNIIKSGSGSLYYCKTENEPCKQIADTGYYVVDKETVYSCSSTNCKKDTIVSTCNVAGVGKIVFAENKFSICLKENTAVELLKSNNGNYIVTGSVGNLFASNGKYAIITLKDQTIILNSKYNNNMKYVYVNGSDTGNQKVMEKDDKCPKDSNTNTISGILEFECTNGICTKIN